MNTVTNGPKIASNPQTVKAQPQVVARDNTRVATPQVKLDSSNLSVSSEKSNPFSSISNQSATVKVDGWKKGKNDSIEGILKNQGYSLKEIYSKDANGKSLVDKVAAANKLKNPNVIQPGQELVVPSKENSESLSSKDLGNGHSQSASVNTGEVSIDAKMSKDKDGVTTASTKANAGDASISSDTSVSEKGRVDTSISRDGESVNAETVAISGDSSAITRVNTTTKPGESGVSVSDIDSDKNLSVTADNNNVKISNGAKTEGDNVDTNLDISERSTDGIFERGGAWLNRLFGGKEEEAKSVDVQGASNVKATKNADGQTTVTATVNGKTETILETAGDTDDSWIERAGESVDNGFRAIGRFFTGDGEGTSKSDITKQTRRGRRKVNN